jgi:predicted DNA-binding transcriptional regulator YafY
MSQAERLFFIDRTVREQSGVTIKTIAKVFEICDRQAKRDIEYMRDRLLAPLEWIPCRKRYEYTSPWDGLKFADENSLLAFAFLRAILMEYHYVPVVSDDLITLIKSRIAGRYSDITDKVRYEIPDMEPIHGEISYSICQALLTDKKIEIEYTDAHGAETSRSIAPVRLVNYSGKWYCAAQDYKSGSIRVFAIARIRKARLTEEAAETLPDKATIESFLSSSYGIFKGEPRGNATLRFSGGAARIIRDQTWHKDQIMHVTEEGNEGPVVELTLPVHDWSELLGRALRCGAHCEVLAPPEFRTLWVEEIKTMAELAKGSRLIT